MSKGPTILFNFDKTNDLSDWYVVDDVVMGGRSDGNLEINAAGHGVYHGDVSLKNNGGFSSIRHRFAEVDVSAFTVCKIRLKGDGKQYQFRTKPDQYDRHSYVYNFETSGDWETVEIPLAELYPTFRGRRLDMNNFPGEKMEEIAILISNKRAESFELVLDWVGLE